MKIDLDDICFWHSIAEDERELNDMSEVIQSYKKIGCYDCDGYNKKCTFYKQMEEQNDSKQNRGDQDIYNI